MKQIFTPQYSPKTRGTVRRRKMWLWFRIVVAVALVSGAVAAAITLHKLAALLPDPNIAQYVSPEATTLYDRRGEPIAKLYVENREFVSLPQVPDYLVHATVAVEDSRFYEHQGIDFRGVARAIVHDVRARGMVEGGSTITQQLARNIYLTRTKTFGRKLQEAMLAVQIERRYSKDEILQLYLNEIYYGSRAYGVQAASRVYFNKEVKDLDLAECAMLAGLPKRPSDYSPYESKPMATARRNVVLKRMFDVGYISYDEYTKAVKEKIRLGSSKPPSATFNKAPCFVSYVRKQLEDEFGPEIVYNAGLKVYTTLDLRMQRVAQQVVTDSLAKERVIKMDQAALVALDAETGDILAMVGGKEPTIEGFNRAVQAKRLPGSSFKLFVYTAATDAGKRPTDTVLDAPFTVEMPGQPAWHPSNYDHRYHGAVSLLTAFACSYNVCAARLMHEVGVDATVRWARLMGITSDLTAAPSLALGTSAVSVLEMANAYGVVAASGIHAEPAAFRTVVDRFGRTLLENKPKTTKVMEPDLAATMQDYTRHVVTSGTGRSALDIPDAHGKTGTTSSYRDAWFCGFSGKLACAVWVGNDDYAPLVRRGGSASGSTAALPIWRGFMREALKLGGSAVTKSDSKPDKVTKPKPTSTADKTVKPTNNDGNPTPSDETIYVLVTICDETGQVATPDCPAAIPSSSSAATSRPPPAASTASTSPTPVAVALAARRENTG